VKHENYQHLWRALHGARAQSQARSGSYLCPDHRQRQTLKICLKRTVNISHWDGPGGYVKASKEAARELNPYIDEIRQKLMDCYRQLQLQNKIITAAAIRNLFFREEKRENTLCGLMLYHSVNMKAILQPAP